MISRVTPSRLQAEAPVEPATAPDLFVAGLEDLEIGRGREPAFEASCDVIASGAELRTAGQEQPRLHRRCETLGESVEVA